MSNLIVARRALLFVVLIYLVLPLQLGAGSQTRPWRIAYDACVAVVGENGYEPYCEIRITDDESNTRTVMGGVEPAWSADGLHVATIMNAAHATMVYRAAGNHDPNGDSNGTVITVSRQ